MVAPATAADQVVRGDQRADPTARPAPVFVTLRRAGTLRVAVLAVRAAPGIPASAIPALVVRPQVVVPRLEAVLAGLLRVRTAAAIPRKRSVVVLD